MLQVGSGYNDIELKKLQETLEPHWKHFDAVWCCPRLQCNTSAAVSIRDIMMMLANVCNHAGPTAVRVGERFPARQRRAT